MSSEGSDEVLEDSDNESSMKKRISNSDEEEGGGHEAEAIGMYLSYLLSFSLHPSSLLSSSLFFFISICMTS